MVLKLVVAQNVASPLSVINTVFGLLAGVQPSSGK
jgi:hypothetical protein